MRINQDIKQKGYIAANFAASPAYVEMVLGYLQLLKDGELYYPAKDKDENGGKVQRTSINIDKGIVNTRVTELMVGLDLIFLEPIKTTKIHNGVEVKYEIKLTDKGSEILDVLKTAPPNVRFICDDSNPDEIEVCLKKMQECSGKLYEKMRNVFFTSPLYSVLNDYLDANSNFWISEKEFKNKYWDEINIAYGSGSTKSKKSGKRTTVTTTGDNVGSAILQWFKMFGIYCANTNSKDTFMLSRDVNEIVRRKLDGNSKQVIFTGAPGTGKTFAVKEYIRKKSIESDKEIFKFIQFHSSYDYTDFVEGLRPANDKGKMIFVRMDGVFKAFCRYVVGNNLQKINDSLNKKYTISDCFEILTNPQKRDEAKSIRNELDKMPNYYFVIDEINRADLSKVFGELLLGLEADYRGVEHRFDTQYSNLDTYAKVEKDGVKVLEDDCFKDGFFIPRNLRLIGTMNDIDRSVDSIDFALRRRFEWVEVKANEVMKQSLISMQKTNGIVGVDDNLAERIMAMNDFLSTSDLGLNSDYHIGPAYFKDYDKDKNNLDEVFNDKIKPILREYLRGHDEKKVSDIIKQCQLILKR